MDCAPLDLGDLEDKVVGFKAQSNYSCVSVGDAYRSTVDDGRRVFSAIQRDRVNAEVQDGIWGEHPPIEVERACVAPHAYELWSDGRSAGCHGRSAGCRGAAQRNCGA